MRKESLNGVIRVHVTVTKGRVDFIVRIFMVKNFSQTLDNLLHPRRYLRSIRVTLALAAHRG